MKKINLLVAGALAATVGLASVAHASVVAGPIIDGLATFTDTTTGDHWLKLNDFFNETGDQMISTATAAGFTVADNAQVTALTNTLPLGSGQWASYAAVMGSAPNRGLMWGAYGPETSGNLGWAYAYSTDIAWTILDNQFPANQVSNAGGPFTDEDLWAFSTGAGGGVPEPAAWAMMLVGFAGLGGMIRSRRRTATASA